MDSRDLDIESSSKSINIDQIQSIKQDNSENLVKKPSSRFISISNTKNIDSLNISRDDEFDLYDKSKMTLIEKCATIPRRSSETEVLIKKGRFTIIREANNNNYSISRSGESSTKIRKNTDHLLLTSFHSNSPLSSNSPYFSNSQMCSSPLSSSFTFHSENNNKNPRRASDSVAHHYKISSQHDNISNHKQLSIIPLQRSHIIHQHSPTSSPHTSPNTTPTSTLVSPLSKSFSSISTIIKPNNTQSNTHSNQSNRRIFELEGSYFPNNSVSPSSSGSNNNNLSSKRRRKFIIETFE
ncbi:12284_t:CDS:2 [Rhizophagus irregularis]|nr:12284_t:CDS:2 [Rhizophagus irregularis]